MNRNTDRNLQLIVSLYEAWDRNDAQAAMALFDEKVEWYPAEGHPYSPDGQPWIGLKELTAKFFARVSLEWPDMTANINRVHAAGNTVIVEGRYRGTFEPTKRRYNAQFCHVWTLSEAGRILRLRQYADTAQMQRVMSPFRSKPEVVMEDG